MNYCENIAHNLKKRGWNCGSISSTDHNGRQLWIVAAECEGTGRFIVRSDELLTAFLELEAAIFKQDTSKQALKDFAGRGKIKI